MHRISDEAILSSRADRAAEQRCRTSEKRRAVSLLRAALIAGWRLVEEFISAQKASWRRSQYQVGTVTAEIGSLSCVAEPMELLG